MTGERIPVEPGTIEVMGHRVKADDAAWTGLDWSRDDGSGKR